MANNIRNRVWVLDTVATVFTSRVFIQKIEWFAPATIGDDMALTDILDKVVQSGQCEVAGGTQVWYPEAWFNGLKLATLTSGVVHVTIG